MDGARRVLRSLRSQLFAAVPASQNHAFAGFPTTAYREGSSAPRLRAAHLVAFAVHPATTLLFCAAVLGGAAGYGAVRGGAVAAFTEHYGPPGDLIAGAFGLNIDTITIGGLTELKEAEVLEASGISSRNSLLFLDAQGVRAKLMALPLVREAAVRKLYPSRVSIVISERQPFALWQKDGRVTVVSADGAPISALSDGRFAKLPFVVGEGANARLDDYAALLEAAGDFKARIKAGIRVADRRWDLVTAEGITVRLPEENAAAAVALVARLSRDQRIFDKDIVALDLRTPGRVIAELSDDAGAARVDAMARKISGKGKA